MVNIFVRSVGSLFEIFPRIQLRHKIGGFVYIKLYLLIGLTLAGVAEPGMSVAQQVGTLPGAATSTASGAAAYAIPIAVPPGTAGMVPSLSLQYNSQAGNGSLGVGWSLTGLPRIVRCPQTRAQDNAVGGITYTTADRFCYNGQRLVAISGGYGGNLTEYRTEIDSFVRIAGYATGTAPTYFVVTTRSGMIMEFGNTADSKVMAAGTSVVAAWAIDKVTDTSGNYYSVTYTTDSGDPNANPDGYVYPLQISYTGNAAAGLTPYNYVKFTYSNSRSDIIQSFAAGSIATSRYLLTHIKTYNGATPVSDYTLTYTPYGALGVSQLSQVTLWSGDDTQAIKPTTIVWASGANAPNGTFTYSAANFAANGGNLSGSFVIDGSNPSSIIPGDFNGDGRTDFVVLNPTAQYCFMSNGNGTFTADQSNYTPAGNWTPPPRSSGGYAIASGDFNGDGKTDYAIIMGTYIYTYISNGNGFFTVYAAGYSPAVTLYPSDMTVISGDFDGDGYVDFVVLSENNYYFFKSNGNGSFTMTVHSWNSGTPVPLSFAGAMAYVSGDFNGDGRTDFTILSSTNQYVYLSNGDGTFSLTIQASPANFGANDSRYISGDFNGDGLTDYAVIFDSNFYVFLSKGNGLFYSEPVATYASTGGVVPQVAFTSTNSSIITGDFNGDGKTDFAFLNDTEMWVFLSKGAGTFSSYPSYYSAGGSVTLSYGAYPQVVGDFDGNGISDFVMLAQSGTGYAMLTANGAPYSEISSITNGLGQVAAMSFGSIANPALYAKGSSAVFPNVDTQAPMRVLTSLVSSDGIGGANTTNYTYGFAQVNLYGRGFLGFEVINARDAQSGNRARTVYSQTYPMTGMVTESTQFHLNSAGADVVHYDRVYTLASKTPPGQQIGGIRAFPYASTITTNRTDLDGTVWPTLTSTYVYDGDLAGYTYGNIITDTEATSDGYKKTIQKTYNEILAPWMIDQVQSTVTTYTSPYTP